jgi:hypothetical protein
VAIVPALGEAHLYEFENWETPLASIELDATNMAFVTATLSIGATVAAAKAMQV